MFQELGPDAWGLLGVITFFPQGVNKNHLGWLFPTIPNRINLLEKFGVLSLTYQSDGFVTITGDKDPNTHQAHAGYIGSTDNK